MTHRKRRACCFAVAIAWTAGAACAGSDDRSLSVGALAFGDLYYVPNFHNEASEDAAGLVMRRAYLTFDAELGADWFGRVRLEANQSGEFENYDVEADVKDLYLGRNFGKHELIIGLSPTPTYDLIEDFWGLRYLARTPMDLQGLPSRNTGVALRGPLSADGKLSYRVMLGVGDELGASSEDGDKLMTAMSWKPDTRWTIDLFADYEAVPGPADRRTLQAFVGYESDAFRWGLQYSDQDREDDPPVELVSGFLVTRAGPRSNVILRVDHLLEPSVEGDDIDYLPFDPSARATMLIAGLEFRYGPHYALTPNVVIKRYDDDATGRRPDTDVHLRLTLFVDFE